MKLSNLIVKQKHVLGILLVALVVTIYGLTLTYWHSGDDLQWVGQVESFANGTHVIHPASTISTAEILTDDQPSTSNLRYFLELPTSAFMHRIFGSSDSGSLVVRSVQWGHVLFGSVGILFFYLTMVQILPAWWSIVLSLGVTASYAWWYYSTHLDYTITSHAFASVLLYLLISLLQSTTKRKIIIYSVLLGIVNAVVILYLLTGILFVPVILFILLLQFRKISQKTLKFRSMVGGYIAGFVITLALLFVISSSFFGGISSILSHIQDNISYSGATAHDFHMLDIPKSWYGFTKGLAIYPGLDGQTIGEFLASQDNFGKAAVLGWYGLLMIVGFVPFLGFIWFRKQLKQYRLIIIALTIWFFLNFPFAIYWEPTYIKWWTGALLPWWGLVGLAIAVSGSMPRLRKLISAGVVGLVVTIFSINLSSDFLPRSKPDNNRWLNIAQSVSVETTSDDLFFSPISSQTLDFYLPYFENRRTLSYPLVYATIGRDEDVARSMVYDVVRSTMEQGNRVFVYDCNERSIPDWHQYFADDHGLNVDVVFQETWDYREIVSFCELTMSNKTVQ